MLEIVFIGTRKGMNDAQQLALHRLLFELSNKGKIHVIAHHGLCKGFDVEAHDLLRKLVDTSFIIGHPPSYKALTEFRLCDEYRDEAGFLVRNFAMIDELVASSNVKAEDKYVIAASRTMQEESSQSGTWATVRYARKKGQRIYVLMPDGTIEKDGALL